MKTERSSFSVAASPGSLGDDLDRHPERAERVGEGLGAGPGGERRRAEAARGHRAEQRHVGEAGARVADERGDLALQLRRRGVQVRVDRAVPSAGSAAAAAPSAAAAELRLSTTSAPATAASGRGARATPSTSRPAGS